MGLLLIADDVIMGPYGTGPICILPHKKPIFLEEVREIRFLPIMARTDRLRARTRSMCRIRIPKSKYINRNLQLQARKA